MIDRRYANTPHGQVHYRITGDGDALVLLGPAGRSAAKVRAVLELIRHARLATIEERDGGFATLENRADELAHLLREFCSITADRNLCFRG